LRDRDGWSKVQALEGISVSSQGAFYSRQL
jgi:hypothetical protein